MKNLSTALLDDLKVIQWCYEPLTKVSLVNSTNKPLLLVAAVEEAAWGNIILGKINLKQWTTTLCQNVVKEALIKLGRKNVRKVSSKTGSIRKKKYSPDWECDEYVYEVKGRSWTTPGTAGEKILGVPLKYGEVPRLYGKPLQIILVGYQEYEARENFAFGDLLDGNNQTTELKDALKYHSDRKISYVGFTKILEQIGYPNGCWKKP